MAALASLPTELLVYVTRNLGSRGDLAALARTDRRFYEIANPLLYKFAAKHEGAWPLQWAARTGVVGTLRRLLENGVDPNQEYVDTSSQDVWKKSRAAVAPFPPPGTDEAGWSSDHGSESDHNLGWSPGHMSDSDHAGTSQQPSSDSSRSGPYVDSYEHSRTEAKSQFRSDMPSEYSDDEMVDVYDDSDDNSLMSEDLGFGPGGDDSNMYPRTRSFRAIHLAARAGHVDTIRLLLDYGATVNVGSEHFCDCGRLQGLLNAAECPEKETSVPSWSALHVALCCSQPEVAKLLLSRGAALQMDLAVGLGETVELVSSVTALHHAAAHGLSDVVSYIIDQGLQTEIDVRDERTLSPFYYAFAHQQWETTVPLLLSYGANINLDTKMFLPYSTITPLGECCRTGRWEGADRLMALGVDVRRGYIATGTGRGLSPLHMACLHTAQPVGLAVDPRVFEEADGGFQRARTIQNLIDRGALVNGTDCAGDTPLVHASQNHLVTAINVLLRAGADVHARNGVQRTVLMQAVLGPPNPVNTDPRHFAEALSQVLRFLFEAGARLEDVDPDHNTALHLVFQAKTQEDYRHAVQCSTLRILLRQPGARQLLAARNLLRQTPLHIAFHLRNYEACDILARSGLPDGTLFPQELVDMFFSALEDTDPSRRERGLNFVLDLDTDRVLSSDPRIFTRLLAETGSLAIVGASVLAARGLPQLDAYDYTTFLCQAIEAGDFSLGFSLIEGGADVNAANAEGYTPLVLCLLRDQGQRHTDTSRASRQFTQVLLNRGANIHRQSPHVRPLTKAIVEGWASTVTAMLKQSPLQNDSQAQGGCYLHDAVTIMRGVRPVPNDRIIDALLSSGAALGELDRNGDTPLSVLLQSLCEERTFAWRLHRYIRLLHGPDVDVNHKNKRGMSAADYLQELLHPTTPEAYRVDFLSQRLQVVANEDGCREIVYVANTPVPPRSR